MQTKSKIFKDRLHEIIFEADTPMGKAFDVVLLIFIVLSVIVVILDSIISWHLRMGGLFYFLEWMFTIIFTLEYLLRIYITRKPYRYIFSFYGIIDFLSIIPTYLSLIFAGTQFLIVIRILRILRVFRIMKLARYVAGATVLGDALKNSRHKIVVFLEAVLVLVLIMGSLMYLIEGPENGFTSIPKGIYWAIVTLTTVGYGDITPQTALGQTLSSIVMILGYAIIAVPTGIISAEIASSRKKQIDERVCSSCHKKQHDENAVFCNQCGEKLS